MAQGRLVGFGILALVMAYASGLSMFWNSGRQVPSSLAPQILRTHPDALMKQAARSLIDSEGQIQQIELAEVKAGLKYAPLGDEPFVVEAARQMVSGRTAEAETLLRIALRRNPRSREARVLMLDLLAAQGDARGAVAQIEVLYRLMPNRRPLLRDALVYLASLPSTRRDTLEAISEDTHKREVLEGFARSGASASFLLDTLEAFEPFDFGEREKFTASLATPLLRAGDWQGARRVWGEFNPGAFVNGNLLIDPQLTGEYGPPFGWELRSGRHGYARLDQAGLTGEFYGRRAGTLAAQTIVLDPGRYRLTTLSEEMGRGLAVALKCLGQEDLSAMRLSRGEQSLEFFVDVNCPALELLVQGIPSDPPTSTSFRIRHVGLERAAP